MRGVYGVLAASVVVCAVATGSSVMAQTPGPSAVPAKAKRMKAEVPPSPEAIEDGKGLYMKYCRSCHGEDGSGGRANAKGIKPSNLTDREWVRGSSEGTIFWVIQNGVPPSYHMRGFKGTLSDENIWKVVHYVRSLGGVTKTGR